MFLACMIYDLLMDFEIMKEENHTKKPAFNIAS
jgi:hypothetical protein